MPHLTKGCQRGRGFAVFGDTFRDAIKGGVFDVNKGYVQAGLNVDRIKRGIEGSVNDFADGPLEAVNYVACHDNHTLWDRLWLTTRNDRNVSDADRRLMDRLAAALVLTSQGIPFLEGGQDLLRTKHGEWNSYDKPDSVNAIDWQWKRDHLEVFAYYRHLIALRKAHPIFRMTTKAEVAANLKFFDDHLAIAVPPKCVGYRLTRGNSGDAWSEALVLFNPNPTEVTFALPDGTWAVVADPDGAGAGPVTGRKIKVPRIRAAVLYRE
jgi:pullulanase